MAMYVFKDEARKEKVIARNTTKRNKEFRYYCPNLRCNARMFLWSLEGESKPFFRSVGKPGHVEYCPYGSENKYNPEKVKEEGFDSADAIRNMMAATISKRTSKIEKKEYRKNDSAEERVPHTINQIYDMCKSYDCRDTFNDQKIGQILVDDRSIYMYPKGVYGYRLIEAKCRKYFYENNNFFLVSSVNGEEYQFELKCIDDSLFVEIKDLLFANQDKIIVVAGLWEKSGVYNRFSTIFNSKRQIKITKQKI